MLRSMISSGIGSALRSTRNCRLYSERRRRKGDGTKTDIFDERAAASQEEYFRKKTARQLQLIKEQMRKEREERDKREKAGEQLEKNSESEEKPATNNPS